MAQAHKQGKPVIYPQSTQQESKAHKADPYNPYGSLFNSQLSGAWIELYQKFWQNYWEWASYQQKATLNASFEASRWFVHCLQLSSQPNILYRYLRLYWQKPFMGINAQALTGARMWTHMMMENGTLLQKSMSNIIKEKSSHTHH